MLRCDPNPGSRHFLYPLSSVNFHNGVQTGVNLFRHAEHAFGIRCYLDQHSLGRVNKCKQREKQGHSSGAATCDGSNIHYFAVERALFNCLDSDCDPLTELDMFQLIFIEFGNHPRVVSELVSNCANQSNNV
jgi:hypothetical protein